MDLFEFMMELGIYYYLGLKDMMPFKIGLDILLMPFKIGLDIL